jgi:hypothetical protein
MTTWRQIEVTKRTIRFEFASPVDLKTLGVACTLVGQEFEKRNGRMPSHDDDYWLEPMDEGIAFCFMAGADEVQL